MKIRQILSTTFAITLLASFVQAAPPTTVNEAITQIQADSVLISGWVADQLKKAVPFNSTSGNTVPSQLKLFGFEVGVEVVATGTKTNKDEFHNLGTSVVDTNQIDMFSRLPFGMILGHAKIGLPFGMDGGIRLGGIPSTDADSGDTHVEISNKVVGLDVRKVLIEEGVVKPFGLTIGLDYTHASGHIDATTPYDPSSGSGVTIQDASGALHNEWDTDSLGVQVLINKKIAFINPYLGVAANKNFGTFDTSITNTGTVTAVNGTPTAPQSYTTTGAASTKTNEWDLRGKVGLEFTLFPFMKLGLGGEFANQNNLGANLGLRVQFH